MWNIVSTILGLTGIVLAVFFYFKGRPVRRISYLKKSFSLLGKSTTSLKGFSASYQGQKLSVLTASKIMLWNDGNTTISWSDMASSENLSIQFSDAEKVLECQILSVSSKSNGVSLTLDSQRLSIDIEFDYFDPGQGLVISVLHAGDGKHININGVIKGGSITKYELPKWPKMIGYASLFFTLGIAMLTITDFFEFNSLYLLLTIILAQIIGMVFMNERSLFLKRKAQRSLEASFEEDFTPQEFKG